MKRTFKLLLALICISSMMLPVPAAVFAETTEAQTAAKTVRVSKDEKKEGDPDDLDQGPAEQSKESEENRIETQDGLSEKSKA